jgi:hypothetical protein
MGNLLSAVGCWPLALGSWLLPLIHSKGPVSAGIASLSDHGDLGDANQL